MADQEKANTKEAKAEKAEQKKDAVKQTKAVADAKSNKAKTKKKRKNPFKSIIDFFKSVNSERKKVVWPTAKETLKNALVVIVVCIIAGVAIYIVDSVLSLGMKGIKNLASDVNTTAVVEEEDADEEDADTELVEEDAEDSEDSEDTEEAGDTESSDEETTIE